MHLVDDYDATPSNGAPDTDNGLFNRSDRVDFKSTSNHATDLRDISEFVLESSGVEFRIYSLHLKSKWTSSADQERLNTLPRGANLIVIGNYGGIP